MTDEVADSEKCDLEYRLTRDAREARKIAEIANSHGWDEVENSKLLSGFIEGALQERDALRKACQIAHDEMCRVSFPGPRDKRGLNYAIEELRKVLSKEKS